MELVLLRRIYRVPELFQLLATFGVVLVVQDLVLKIWGPLDILGPRAPGLRGAVDILGHRFPAYELFLIAMGPLVLGLLWLLMHKTRFGVLVRAATQDREMVGALGVNQALLFTGTLFLGAALAGLGGALQTPKLAANPHMDISVIAEAFVVTVVGGMGSVPGAFLAALLIGRAAGVRHPDLPQDHAGAGVPADGAGAGGAALGPDGPARGGPGPRGAAGGHRAAASGSAAPSTSPSRWRA